MSVQASYDREADIAWFRLPRFDAGSARTERAEWGLRDIDEATGATVGLEFWRARERLPSELLDVFQRPVPPVDASAGG